MPTNSRYNKWFDTKSAPWRVKAQPDIAHAVCPEGGGRRTRTRSGRPAQRYSDPPMLTYCIYDNNLWGIACMGVPQEGSIYRCFMVASRLVCAFIWICHGVTRPGWRVASCGVRVVTIGRGVRSGKRKYGFLPWGDPSSLVMFGFFDGQRSIRFRCYSDATRGGGSLL